MVKRAERFLFDIAGFIISLVSDDNKVYFCIDDAYNKFASKGEPEFVLKVHYGPFPKYYPRKNIFDAGPSWRLFFNNETVILKTTTRMAILDSNFKSGDIYVPSMAKGYGASFPLNYPLAEVLMINLLSKHRGLIMHACGVVDNGYGYLFLGNPTHGKSTIARLWFENRSLVLNDDRIIVREKDGEIWMYGTPWPGDFKEVSSKGLPIQKIFFLRHGTKNSAVLKRGGDAVSMLLTRSFPPLWDKKGMDYTLGLFHRLTNKIPCYELNFVPDKRIIHFVRNI